MDDDRPGIVERFGSKWNPQEGDDLEHDCPPEQPLTKTRNLVRAPRPNAERPFYRKQDAVQGTPKRKVPRCAVPQSAEEHRQHQIAVDAPAGAHATPPERNVEVVAQPA